MYVCNKLIHKQTLKYKICMKTKHKSFLGAYEWIYSNQALTLQRRGSGKYDVLWTINTVNNEKSHQSRYDLPIS